MRLQVVGGDPQGGTPTGILRQFLDGFRCSGELQEAPGARGLHLLTALMRALGYRSRALGRVHLWVCFGADVLLAGPISPADHGAKPVLPRRSKIMLHNGSRSNVAADADRISRRRPRRRPETPIDWSAGPSRLKRPQSESPVSSRGSREWARAVYSSPLRF
jgi:hypothetical protein